MHNLDRPLRDEIECPAIIARKAPEQDAEREADANADEPHGERYSRAVNDTREHVTAEPVCSEEEHLAAFRRADDVETCIEQAPELVRIALAEEAQRLNAGRLDRIVALQIFEIKLVLDPVNERTP